MCSVNLGNITSIDEIPSEIPRYEEQLEKFVDTVDPLIEHAPAKLLEFAKAGKNELLSEQN